MPKVTTRLWQFPVTILLFTALIAVGCDSGGASEENGTVTGQIMAADNTTPIPGATVGLATNSAKSKVSPSLKMVRKDNHLINHDGPTTTTDENGEFTLEGVPAGEQTLAAKRGAFETTFNVNVEAGETTESVSEPVQPARELAFVPGAYDDIQSIVIDLGYAESLDTLRTEDLSDVGILNEYATVFINCGAGSQYTEETTDALRQYMENGGGLYISDLEADHVENLFPDDISFNNNGGTQTITAGVVDSDLRQFVGKDSVEIKYDLGGWERVIEVSDQPDVLLNGQPQELESGTEPLAVSFDADPGRLIYTTFHNEAGTTEDQEAVLRYYVFLP